MKARGWWGLAIVATLSGRCGGDDEKTDTPPDGDADTDSDTDTDTPDDGLFDDEHVLVIPDRYRLTLLASDGSIVAEPTWIELLGQCPDCEGQGASADGDGLLISFLRGGQWGPTGSVARLNADLGLDFRVPRTYDFPHQVLRDPADDTLIVAETNRQRVLWIPGDGSSGAPVRRLGVAAYPTDALYRPNGMSRMDWNGRSLLLVTYKEGSDAERGSLVMWDITVTGAPEPLWRFPSEGGLDDPHGGVLREYDGQWWLLYGHSRGGLLGSTVGTAVTADPTVAPDYVADLVPLEEADQMHYLRGVELTSDGTLYLTDCRSPCYATPAPNGRILKTPMTTSVPTGATGSTGGGQVWEVIPAPEVVLDGLTNPFHAWLWKPTATF